MFVCTQIGRYVFGLGPPVMTGLDIPTNSPLSYPTSSRRSSSTFSAQNKHSQADTASHPLLKSGALPIRNAPEPFWAKHPRLWPLRLLLLHVCEHPDLPQRGALRDCCVHDGQRWGSGLGTLPPWTHLFTDGVTRNPRPQPEKFSKLVSSI